jgi:protoporphyrinogen oxidase
MIENLNYIILGAGPSGLALALTLRDLGEDSFVVLEQEATAGGLCRSEDVDGAPLDIGGGHFLDLKRREVLELLFKFMPRSEWQEYERVSTIRIRKAEIDYPLEANLWQLPLQDQVDFLESIAKAGCNQGLPMPEAFDQWIKWKLGQRIAEEYMLPYNKKIWSIDLNDLGTYWLYKLPNVSFRDTLQSCLEGQAHGSIPAHGRFLYPKQHGYGEVWRRMADDLRGHLYTSTAVSSIDVRNRIVNGRFRAGRILTTIPWTTWLDIANLPDSVRADIAMLRYSSIDVDYYQETLNTRAHWIYDPDEKFAHHRVLCRSNFSSGSRGYWTETNSLRSRPSVGWRHKNEHAYPLNTRDKPGLILRILTWANEHGIIGIGRWGTWEHMNSDAAAAQAINVARDLVKSGKS